MNKKHDTEVSPDNFQCQIKTLEAEKLALMDKIVELEATNDDLKMKNVHLEEEIHQLKENCNCPQVKILFVSEREEIMGLELKENL